MANKILCIITFMIMLVCAFTSCNDDVIDDNNQECEHEYVESIEKEPTCSTLGMKKYTCSICNHTYYETDYHTLEHDWGEPICADYIRCKICGTPDMDSYVWHEKNEIDGSCKRCDYGARIIFSNTPTIVNYKNTKECEIESIKTTKNYYKHYVTFIIESTYHNKGNNYSDTAVFGWKLYDEDGLVIDSGICATDGKIMVGEKSKAEVVLFNLQDGKTYRFEILDVA